jgi:cytochrome c oxidase assembly protein subunit 15
MRSRLALTPETYRRITIAAAILLAIIIVTGGAVRLSGSGLGCSDWPTCEPGQLTPRHSSDIHAMIEFLNRLFTGLVSIAVIVCVLGSLVRIPRRRDLVWLSVGLVIGVFAQAVLGGLTVLFELRPELVTAHFLVSLALLANALVLVRRAGQPDAPARPVLLPSVRWVGPALLVAVSVVVVTGTVVTSTGPHGGDAKAKRFGFFLPDVARVHGISVVIFLLLVLITLWLIRRTYAPVVVQQRLGLVLVAAVVQGAIGYIQYFNGIPELLVGFHIAGATAVWSAVVCFYLSLFSRIAPITGAVEMPAEPTAPAQAAGR